MMNSTQEEINLVGLALKTQTWNANGQSAMDCGNLWQEFEKGKYVSRIKDKTGDEIYAVYHAYEGDHTKPYSYFIGCKVPAGTPVPEGMTALVIPAGRYQQRTVKGPMPDCVGNAWKEIWNSDLKRAYTMDFEVYGEKSRDWKNAEVDIFLSVSE